MKSRIFLYFAAICAVLVFSSTAALADKKAVNEAEQIRLRDEMRRLSQRNVWAGVEKAFNRMKKLRGISLCWYDYQMGAEASRNQDRPEAYLIRMWKTRAAAKKSPKKCSIKADKKTIAGFDQQINILKSEWARVKINAKRKMVINFVEVPFSPDLQGPANAAFKRIKDRGKFSGLLPVSKYKVQRDAKKKKVRKLLPFKGRKKIDNFEVVAANWSRAEKCVKKADRKKKLKHEKCLKKVKVQKFRVK